MLNIVDAPPPAQAGCSERFRPVATVLSFIFALVGICADIGTLMKCAGLPIYAAWVLWLSCLVFGLVAGLWLFGGFVFQQIHDQSFRDWLKENQSLFRWIAVLVALRYPVSECLISRLRGFNILSCPLNEVAISHMRSLALVFVLVSSLPRLIATCYLNYAFGQSRFVIASLFFSLLDAVGLFFLGWVHYHLRARSRAVGQANAGGLAGSFTRAIRPRWIAMLGVVFCVMEVACIFYLLTHRRSSILINWFAQPGLCVAVDVADGLDPPLPAKLEKCDPNRMTQQLVIDSGNSSSFYGAIRWEKHPWICLERCSPPENGNKRINRTTWNNVFEVKWKPCQDAWSTEGDAFQRQQWDYRSPSSNWISMQSSYSMQSHCLSAEYTCPLPGASLITFLCNTQPEFGQVDQSWRVFKRREDLHGQAPPLDGKPRNPCVGQWRCDDVADWPSQCQCIEDYLGPVWACDVLTPKPKLCNPRSCDCLQTWRNLSTTVVWTFANTSAGLCLDVNGNLDHAVFPIPAYLYHCNGNHNQAFYFGGNGSRITWAKEEAICLEQNGTDVRFNDCSGLPPQNSSRNWNYDGRQIISASDPTQCLSIAGSCPKFHSDSDPESYMGEVHAQVSTCSNSANWAWSMWSGTQPSLLPMDEASNKQSAGVSNMWPGMPPSLLPTYEALFDMKSRTT